MLNLVTRKKIVGFPHKEKLLCVHNDLVLKTYMPTKCSGNASVIYWETKGLYEVPRSWIFAVRIFAFNSEA